MKMNTLEKTAALQPQFAAVCAASVANQNDPFDGRDLATAFAAEADLIKLFYEWREYVENRCNYGGGRFVAVTHQGIFYSECEAGAADGGNGGGGAGPDEFINLTDTPASYAGQGGRFVRVNAGATALEFTAIPASGSLDCTTVINGGNQGGGSRFVQCAAGYTVTGGGCRHSSLAPFGNLPDGNGWICSWPVSGSNQYYEAVAKCCRVQ